MKGYRYDRRLKYLAPPKFLDPGRLGLGDRGLEEIQTPERAPVLATRGAPGPINIGRCPPEVVLGKNAFYPTRVRRHDRDRHV